MSWKALSVCVRFPSLNTFGRRFLSAASLLIASLLVFAASAHAATWTVTDTSDSATDTGSLRYALTNAATGDTITFSSGLTGTITLGSALPAISGNLTITGPGAGNLTISGANAYTPFTINSGATASISGLTIANGNATSPYSGGGILNEGTLTVSDCAFTGNSAPGGNSGGAIMDLGSSGPATLNVISSTFIGNSTSAGYGGGAIFNFADSAPSTLNVTNSTFSGNSAPYDSGGAIGSLDLPSPGFASTLTITDSTFSGNSASSVADAGAVFAMYSSVSSTVSVLNSVFLGNSGSGTDSAGGIVLIALGVTSEGNNVFFDNTGGNTGGNLTPSPTDVTGNPMLLALGNYGGTTQTMLPLPGSAAICAGSSSNVPVGTTTDQRSFPLNTSCVDAGAVQTNYMTVNTNADSNDGSCTSTTCSLRDAIDAANGATEGDIDFAASLNGQTITLTSALPGVSGQQNIIGPGANLLTVSGNNSATVGTLFTILSGAQVTLDGLTFADGNGSAAGGIVNAGTVTVMNSTFSGNTSTEGGGLFTEPGTLTVVTNTTFENNTSSSGLGGAINNDGAILNVTNSTFENNVASIGGGGGGIFNSNGGTLSVTNSTFSGNSAGGGGGIFNNSGSTATMTNGIFSGNSTNVVGGAGLYNNGGTLNASYNVYYNNLTSGTEDDCNSCTSNTNSTDAASPVVTALGYYGGSTQTMPPLGGSAAINFGLYQAGEPTADQRGAPRPSTVGAAIDVGSVQVSGNVPVIGSVTPNQGPVAGGTSVTITGTGLDTVTAVAFGSNPSTSFTVTPASGTTLASITATSPAAASAGVVDVTATDSVGTSATSSNDQFTYVPPPLSILPASGSGFFATYGTALSPSPSFTASGGTSPYTFSATGLPSGLSVSSTGEVSGTPAAVGTFPFTVTVIDSSTPANTVTGSYTVTVSAPRILISPATIPSGTVGTAYSQTFTAGGGISPYTYTLVGAPAGLIINTATGVWSGTPTAAGVFNITVTATDANGFVGNQIYPLTIAKGTPVLTWNPPASIGYGTPLSATQLDATSNVTGTFTYTPPSGTVLNVGANQTLSATFVPNDTADYNTPAAITTSITITQGTLDVTANNATRVYGTANPVFSGTVTGALNGNTFTESFTTAATLASNVGTYAIVPSVTGTNLSDYTVNTTNGALTVTQAATTTALSASASSLNPGQSVTLTAQVQSATTGTPTGSVNFYDGATLLGTATLSGGSASFTTSALTAGTTNSLTAAYQGSTDFAASTSSSAVTIPVGALDFTLTYQGGLSLEVTGGTPVTYTFQVSPTANVYPGDVTFSASGLPPGATVTFTPSTVAANGGPQTVTAQVQTAAVTSRKENPFKRGGAPMVLGVLLLPLLGTRRMRNSRLGRNLLLVLAITAGGIGLASLSGCGSSSSGSQAPTNYNITVTATSGAVQHSFSVKLIIEAASS